MVLDQYYPEAEEEDPENPDEEAPEKKAEVVALEDQFNKEEILEKWLENNPEPKDDNDAYPPPQIESDEDNDYEYNWTPPDE